MHKSFQQYKEVPVYFIFNINSLSLCKCLFLIPFPMLKGAEGQPALVKEYLCRNPRATGRNSAELTWFSDDNWLHKEQEFLISWVSMRQMLVVHFFVLTQVGQIHLRSSQWDPCSLGFPTCGSRVLWSCSMSAPASASHSSMREHSLGQGEDPSPLPGHSVQSQEHRSSWRGSASVCAQVSPGNQHEKHSQQVHKFAQIPWS